MITLTLIDLSRSDCPIKQEKRDMSFLTHLLSLIHLVVTPSIMSAIKHLRFDKGLRRRLFNYSLHFWSYICNKFLNIRKYRGKKFVFEVVCMKLSLVLNLMSTCFNIGMVPVSAYMYLKLLLLIFCDMNMLLDRMKIVFNKNNKLVQCQ